MINLNIPYIADTKESQFRDLGSNVNVYAHHVDEQN